MTGVCCNIAETLRCNVSETVHFPGVDSLFDSLFNADKTAETYNLALVDCIWIRLMINAIFCSVAPTSAIVPRLKP